MEDWLKCQKAPLLKIVKTKTMLVILRTMVSLKGCDSNCEANIFQILKVATNEISTLH